MNNTCRICLTGKIKNLLDFGKQPIVHHLKTTKDESPKLYPFELGFCNSCAFLQIINPIPPEILYKNYFTVSSWKNQPHTNRLLEVMGAIANLNDTSSVLEIGCNDGSFMELLLERGVHEPIGIEPTKDAFEIAIKKGLSVKNRFFDANLADELGEKQFDIIVTRQVLEHIFNLQEFICSIRSVLKDEGTLVIEIPDSSWNLEQLDYALWEEHVNYFTISTLNKLLVENGFRIIHKETTLFSGKALTVFAEKNERCSMPSAAEKEFEIIQKFKKNFLPLKERFHEFLSSKEQVFLYGCGARSSSFLHFMELENVISIVDDQVEKQGFYLPKSNIPIVSWCDEYKDAFFLLGVNTENEMKVVKRRQFKFEQYCSILPPSKNIPVFWKRMIDA